MIPKVIKEIVKNDLCIGCGLCVSECPNKAIKMEWGANGFLYPILNGNCDESELCIRVCPFNLNPQSMVLNEDQIAKKIYLSSKSYDQILGNYEEIFIGYSKEFRETSSSGGIGTYLLAELLDRKVVDYIISVGNGNPTKNHYKYVISKTKNELFSTSKTKYYPVTLSEVIKYIEENDGKVALTGIPCFIKAIRLKQIYNPNIKNKIVALIGLACGGLKSIYFTEYLASKVNSDLSKSMPEYRIKDISSNARDYSYGFIQEDRLKTIKRNSILEMWGTGLFKANACDYCDDLLAELADMSLGDAWIKQYIPDGKGNNVVIVRDKFILQIIMDGINKGKLKLEKSSPEIIKLSQTGNYNHRRYGLKIRLFWSKFSNKKVPVKRIMPNPFVLPSIWLVQLQRRRVRRLSLELWESNRNSVDFDNKIKNEIKYLNFVTKINQFLRMYGVQRLFAILKNIKHSRKSL